MSSLGVSEAAPYGLAEATLADLTKSEIALLSEYRKLKAPTRESIQDIIDALDTKEHPKNS